MEAETQSGSSSKQIEEKTKPEPPKDYIHVRARRGQATDSHSLAERVCSCYADLRSDRLLIFSVSDFSRLSQARREKISERMKILQDLVPGCNKVLL